MQTGDEILAFMNKTQTQEHTALHLSLLLFSHLFLTSLYFFCLCSPGLITRQDEKANKEQAFDELLQGIAGGVGIAAISWRFPKP